MLNIQLLEAIYSSASTIFYVTYRLRSLYERDSFGKDSPSNIFNLWYLGSVGLRVPWRYRIAILPTGEAPTSTVRSDLMQVDCYSKDCIFHRIQIILKASAAVRSNNPTVYMIFLFIVTHLMKVITDGFSVTIRSHDDISGDVPLIYRRLRAFSNFLGICVLKFSIYIESWHESYMPIIVIRVIAWTQIENGTSNETKISLLSLISTLGRQGVWILQWHLFEHLRNVSPSHKCMSCNIFYAAWCWM